MLYPSELQPLINRLLQIYYNALFAQSPGHSKNLLNFMNINKKDYLAESPQSIGARVS
jgi:hypothetical protein